MVDASTHIRRGHPITFVLLAIISFIVAVIASVITAKYNDNSPPSKTIRDRVRLLVFDGWWAFVFSIAYLVLFLTGIGGVVTSIAGHGIWLFFTWILWLAGAAALTEALGGGQNCSHSDLAYCNSLEALIAFSWIGWILLTAMLAVVAFIGGGAFRGGNSLKEGIAA